MMPRKDTASDRNGLGLQVWQRGEYRGKRPNLETSDGGQRELLWSFVWPAAGDTAGFHFRNPTTEPANDPAT